MDIVHESDHLSVNNHFIIDGILASGRLDDDEAVPLRK
jgi:hypothetical protein